MDLPPDFFTNKSFLSLAGCAGIVFVVCNALQGALNFNPRWLALALAELVAIYGAHLANTPRVPSDYFIAALNGCLIYCTAVGGTAALAAAKDAGAPKGLAPSFPNSKRGFFSPWL
jgi:hypothetical protein